MMRVDTLGFSDFFKMKKSGRPTAAPIPKQRSWRLVRLNMTFVLIRDRSLGTGIYGIYHLLCEIGETKITIRTITTPETR